MSETIETSPFRKLRHTPMRDLVRLRVTGRLDWKTAIANAGLPQNAGDLIRRIVRKSRLWKLEKATIADELISHFHEGLESGASVDELIQRFGDERQAAVLIRRSARRNRPLLWHAFNYSRWLLATLIAIYLGLCVYFAWDKPVISVNYVARLNEPLKDIPAEQRAWPIYRQALLLIPQRSSTQPGEAERFRDTLAAKPGGKHWDELDKWINANPQVVETIHKGTTAAVLGFRLGFDGDAYDAALFPNNHPPHSSDDAFTNAMIGVLLPYLSELRTLGTILAADARVARVHGESDRLLRDIKALWRLSEQTNEGQLLISSLVSIALRHLALSELNATLSESPGMLDDEALRHLAHRISGPNVAGDLISFKVERMAFYDVVQRLYSDDGEGDGHFTALGLQGIDRISDRPQYGAMGFALTPALVSLMASRRDLTDEYDRMMNAYEANLSLPARNADFSALETRMRQIEQSKLESIRYMPLRLMMPALRHTHWTAERSIAQQEAATTTIALELYHRRHGNYPQTLDALTPGLLPTIPLDHIDGQPLRYRLQDGKPLLYSVGTDRDDDGGRVPRNKDGSSNNPGASRITPPDQKTPDGDWILYPEPKPPEDAEDQG